MTPSSAQFMLSSSKYLSGRRARRNSKLSNSKLNKWSNK